ncbi:MAG: flavin oxidoreductase [Eubacteriales Family XIII. Incertae Sedis bacterium]|nr:MAG: flavin oxidoreductase [Clostridiales Family XIII bacterium]
MRKNLGEGSYVFPMPVFIIGTYDENGVPDAMNAGWGGITGREEITLAISSAHKTAKNIQKKKAFTVSIGTTEHVVSCDYVGLVSANDVPDKLETAGFHTFKSEMVDAPLIEELPFALECELIEYNPENNKLRARIVNICADEEILDENGNIDLTKFHPIVYDSPNNGYYAVGEKIGEAFKSGLALKK